MLHKHMALGDFASNNLLLSPFSILKSFSANFSWDFREPLSQASAFTQPMCPHYYRALCLHTHKIQWWSLVWKRSHRCVWSVNWWGQKRLKRYMYIKWTVC